MAKAEAMPSMLVVSVVVAAWACVMVAAQEKVEESQDAQDVPAPRAIQPDPAAVFADALFRGSAGGTVRNYKKMAQTILPLLVGFKATGLLVMAIAITKFVLLKALFLSTTALLVAGLLALKKFLSSMGQPHDVPATYTYAHQDISHLPYLHPHTAAAEYMDASQVHVPQVTYIGGSYGLQSMQSLPYASSAGIGATGAGLGTGSDDAQGLYSSQSSVATLSQLQQLQQLQQQAMLTQQLGNGTAAQHQPQQQQAGQLLQLSRRRLNAPQGASPSSQYPYRQSRPETRVA